MPMDIRMFFAKKGGTNDQPVAGIPGKGSKSVPTEPPPSMGVASTTTTKHAITEPPPALAKVKTTSTKSTELNRYHQPPTAKSKSTPKTKRRIVIEDHDDDDEEEEDGDDEVLIIERPTNSPHARTTRTSPRLVRSSRTAQPVRVTEPPTKKRLSDTLHTATTQSKEEPHVASATAKEPPPTNRSSTATAVTTKKKSLSATTAIITGPAVKRDLPLRPTLELDRFDTNNDATAGCFDGYTFVFSGVLANLTRDDATEFVKTLGGRVTTTVSRKTDYLVVGEILEDGRPYQEGAKYKKAMELGTFIVLGEKALYGLAQQYCQQNNKANTRPLEPNSKVTSAATGTTVPSETTITTSVSKNPYAKSVATKNIANPYMRVTSNPYANKQPTAKSSPTKQNASSSISAATAATSPIGSSHNQLWVDKYKPVTSADILGNQDAVRKLQLWLQTWEDKFLNDKAIGKTFSNPTGPWKAALLSGPPGIGKTTTATLVAKESGRDVLEFNASDVRSKKSLQEGIGDVTGSCTLEFRKQNQTRTKRCIIMDEVDGMGAGDRSGMAELIQMIKHSRVPIICICNDRQSPKMKSLLPYCMDLKYRRPQKSVIATRAVEVAQREGLLVERNAAEAIAESCGNDVRQVLNCLQMWSSNNSGDSRMTYKSLKERENSINKDEILRVSLFDAARLLLEGRKGLSNADATTEREHFFRRSDAFFVDYNFMGLLVHQNYLKVVQGQFNEAKRSGSADDVLDRMSHAADSMSEFALAENSLRSGQNWSLMPFCAALTIKTGYHSGGDLGGFLPGYPEFTSWLGKNSSRGKKSRILFDLQHHLNYKVSCGSTETRLAYLPVLRERILSLLVKGDEDCSMRAISFMDEYGLDRDDVLERLDEFVMDSKAKRFSDLDSKQKASFTRLYNAGAHQSQALVAQQGGPSGTRGTRRNQGPIPEAGEAVDPDAIDDDINEIEEDEDDEELDADKIKAMFKRSGRKGAGSSTKAAASRSKRRGRS